MMQSQHRASTLDIRLFGSFSVCIGGQPLAPLHTRKGRYLLALLTLRHEREVEREWLAGTLWPDSTERQALHNLRQTLSNLRRALGAEAYLLGSPTPHTLCLDLTGSAADVVSFDQAIARGDEASLKKAIDLYSGPLLEDCLEEWAPAERESREQAYLGALETLARHKEECGEKGEAARLLRLAVGVDPLRESAQRRLMRVLASDGNDTGVRQVYRDLRLLMHREFNSEPDPETAELFQQLRGNARRTAKGRTRGGEISVLAPAAPPRMPHPLTELIGREEEVREIKMRLASSRLVTLTGTGGVGKTRLALAVAEEVAVDYADGVWFVELASLSDPALVAQTVATALSLHEVAGRPSAMTVADFLRERQALLVLDNCEHLLSVSAPLTAAWLSDCPSLCILATSRQPLGLTGEVAWRVPSLATPPPEALGTQDKNLVAILMEYSAVRLFVERVVGSGAVFALTVQNVAAVAQICHRLEGVPLAIELAAARVRSLSVEEINAKLDHRFRLLTGGNTALPRQQTLRAAIDWSYDLLTPQEKALLHRLSVFSGGWTLEAAELVCIGQASSAETIEEWEVLDLLTGLVDKSLALPETREGHTRYRLLETVRQYAQERLVESGEAERVRGRHCDHFQSIVHSLNATHTGAEWQVWLRRVDRDYDNVRAALNYCLGNSAYAEAGFRAAVALELDNYWLEYFLVAEGYALLQAFLARPETQEPTPLRGRALVGAGFLALCLGECTTAIPLLEEALSLLRQHGTGVAGCLGTLGGAYFDMGEPEWARPFYEEGLAAARELEWSEMAPSWQVRSMLLGLSNVCRLRGEYEAARRYAGEIVALYKDGTEWCGHAALANILVLEGRLTEAREGYVRSLLAWRSGYDGQRKYVVSALERLAALDVLEGRWEQAARLLGACEAYGEATYSPVSLPDHAEFYDAALASLRAALDADAFAAAWEKGRQMTFSQALEYALEECKA